MLAAIDDDSDSDSQAAQHALDPKREALAKVAGNVRRVQGQPIIQNKSNDELEAESDAGAPIVPRGKLAARLQDQTSRGSDHSSDCVNDDKENAYARIKKQLLQGGPKRAHESFDPESDVLALRKIASRISPSTSRKHSCSPSDPNVSQRNTPISSRRSSPGLFLTPGKSLMSRQASELPASENNSDSDLPQNLATSSRFLELVARKRAEREAKQAEEHRKRSEHITRQRLLQHQPSRDASSDSGLSDEDKAADRKLTQQARPTRKASKKALEEMNRETQRMSRNMQLAHQAKTKKKITKDSLFARFNFRTPASPKVEMSQNLSSSTAPSSRLASDMEDVESRNSPPTSPIDPIDSTLSHVDLDTGKDPMALDSMVEPIEPEDSELPSMHDIMAKPMPNEEKGKGRAIEVNDVKGTGEPTMTINKTPFTQRPIRIQAPKSSSFGTGQQSDSDLEVMPAKKSKKAKVDVFNRVTARKVQDARSLQTLRALARLNSPEKQRRGKVAAMSLIEMQTSLQKRARQQAVEERVAKIEDLKNRGIIVQSMEERQKDQAEVEDLLEKARRDNEELKQRERRVAKKEKRANGEVCDLIDTSDEDEDYEEIEEPDIEISGSEDEHNAVDDSGELASDTEESQSEPDESQDLPVRAKLEQNGLINNEASEDGDDEEDVEDASIDDDLDEQDEPSDLPIHRSRRNRMVVADDEDEEVPIRTQDTAQPLRTTVEVPTFPLGLESSKLDCEPMGMTQAFAATMADTQTQADAIDDEQDSLAFLGPPPEPNFPMFDVDDSPHMIEDSQKDLQLPDANKVRDVGSNELQLELSQSQIYYDTLGDIENQATATQLSEMPDPTQDVGFVLSSPAPERYIDQPPSTVDTVLLSPIQKRRGRLRRGAVLVEEVSGAGEAYSPPVDRQTEMDAGANAFDVMKRMRKEISAAEIFDKKKSEAKTMVEEQAQESEDEYAGLGGVSDDESGGEEDDFVKELIDQGEVNVDERKLAALYAYVRIRICCPCYRC